MSAEAANGSALLSVLVCSGCGCRLGPDVAEPFRCPQRRAGDDIDHVLVRQLLGPAVEWPGLPVAPAPAETQPFVYFRRFLHSWRAARAGGLSDAEWCDLVSHLDEAVAQVDGAGFTFTPYGRADELSDALGFSATGGVFIKDETGNVSGSHKARHLMGLALWLRVTERLAWSDARPEAPLAIASCGNAALAAAVVARAAKRELKVFVPVDADGAVVERLQTLGAEVLSCERRAGDPPGDPCLHRFHEAVDDGALPFTCQGNENGLVVEGGCTLAWELICQHNASGHGALDRLFIQVGGGALASSVGQGLVTAKASGALRRLPALHAVQTVGAAPLSRAWRRITETTEQQVPGGTAQLVEAAAQRRSQFMWPWETLPASAATGILDDETYDWVGVLKAVAVTGGDAVVVTEEHIAAARALGRRHTDLQACTTGTAGLAGLLACLERGGIGPDERVAVLFTGSQR